MDRTYWQRQTEDKPLYPKLLWDRPINRQLAGKLAIIGGNAYGFAAPAEAYQVAGSAGIGQARVVLPDSLRTTIGGKATLETEYASSTPSGSFSHGALAAFLSLTGWSDGVLLAGDFGHNSETAILLENFMVKYSGQLTLTKDVLDYFITTPEALLERPNSLIVASFAQLQKIAIHLKKPIALTFSMDLLHLVEALKALTDNLPVALITRHNDVYCVAYGGIVSTTTLQTNQKFWRVSTATKAATWWLQNPSKTLESLTTAMLPPASHL